MGIDDFCSVMLADLTQLYLCSYSTHAARAALVMQVSCSLVVCTALEMQKQMQTCNKTTLLHICITSVAQRARLCCCTSILGCCVLQGGQNHYMRRNAKMWSPFGEP